MQDKIIFPVINNAYDKQQKDVIKTDYSADSLLINRNTSWDFWATNTLLFPIHYLAVGTETPTVQS